MLTARSVLTAVLLIAALTVVAMGIGLWRSMEPSPLAADTYGTRAHGQRGVYELLAELQVPERRELLPPEGNWQRPTTLVIWQPHGGLVQLEPAYLRQLAAWVQAGGRLVVALPRADSDEILSPALLQASRKKISLLKELGLPNVRGDRIDLPEPEDTAADEAGQAEAGVPESTHAKARHRRGTGQHRDVFSVRGAAVQTVPVTCGGQLRTWANEVKTLEVPAEELQVLDTADNQPAGWLRIKTADDTEETLVALYPLGQGQIVLVGDAALLENRLLGQADNAPLAWRLLVVPGREVVWDEFYHGLTIRGNPLYLLRREPFGALMAAILILIAVCIWRQAVRFGPPLSLPPASRRTLAEYIETMARLFARGRGSQPFLFKEMRSGTLWLLRSELGLKLGQEQLDTIAAVLRRKRPARAAALIDAVHEIDRALAADRDLTDKEAVLTLQGISACL